MKNKLMRLSVAAIAICTLAAVPVGYASAATPSAKSKVCEGVTATGGDCTSDNKITDLIATIVQLLSAIVGIVAVIMIIIGGLKYVTASGDANSISSAKNTIMYALVGLIIAAMAQVIARFVLRKVTS